MYVYNAELDRFKRDVHLLRYVIERHGYERQENSTRSSHVLGHPTSGDKIIARLATDGHWTYFSVRDENDNGTVVDFLLRRLRPRSLGEVRKELRGWLRMAPPERAEWTALARPAPAPDPRHIADDFAAARIARGSEYLESRGLRPQILSSFRFETSWRIGARSNVLFPHRDETGDLTGFEIKNRSFTSFSRGGKKSAWQSNRLPSDRALVIAESAIDALSYCQLHQPEALSYRYLSTAGAPSKAQFALLDRLLAELSPESSLIAAVDRDGGGDRLCKHYAWLARRHPKLTFRRHSPDREKDWNDVLQHTRGHGLSR
jgi:hypothetical protein